MFGQQNKLCIFKLWCLKWIKSRTANKVSKIDGDDDVVVGVDVEEGAEEAALNQNKQRNVRKRRKSGETRSFLVRMSGKQGGAPRRVEARLRLVEPGLGLRLLLQRLLRLTGRLSFGRLSPARSERAEVVDCRRILLVSVQTGVIGWQRVDG